MKRLVLLTGAAVIALTAGMTVANAQQSGAGATPTKDPGESMGGTAAPKAGQPPAAGKKSERSGSNAQDEKNTNNRSAAGQQNENGGSAAADKSQHSGTTAEDPKNAGNRNAPATGRSAVNGQGGQRDAGATNITTEERGRIHSEISHVTIKEANNIDVQVNVGVAVPRTITEYWEPIPTDILAIVPAWRPYRIVKIHGELLIIDPETFKIIYVIEG